jgi:hypothetical protein
MKIAFACLMGGLVGLLHIGILHAAEQQAADSTAQILQALHYPPWCVTTVTNDAWDWKVLARLDLATGRMTPLLRIAPFSSATYLVWCVNPR